MFDMQQFAIRNRTRCESPDGFNHAVSDWSLSDWMTALSGEVGEAANIIKKLNRERDSVPGNKPHETPAALKRMLAGELADAFCYLDLLAQAAGFDLAVIVEQKFNLTSDRICYTEPVNASH